MQAGLLEKCPSEHGLSSCSVSHLPLPLTCMPVNYICRLCAHIPAVYFDEFSASELATTVFARPLPFDEVIVTKLYKIVHVLVHVEFWHLFLSPFFIVSWTLSLGRIGAC